MLAGHRYQVRYNFYGQVGWGTTTLRSLEIVDLMTQEVVLQRDIPVRYVEPSADDASAASLSTQGDGLTIFSIDEQVPYSSKEDARNHAPVNHVRLLPGPHVIEFDCIWPQGHARSRKDIIVSAGANYTATRQMQGYSLSVVLQEVKRQNGAGRQEETRKEP